MLPQEREGVVPALSGGLPEEERLKAVDLARVVSERAHRRRGRRARGAYASCRAGGGCLSPTERKTGGNGRAGQSPRSKTVTGSARSRFADGVTPGNRRLGSGRACVRPTRAWFGVRRASRRRSLAWKMPQAGTTARGDSSSRRPRARRLGALEGQRDREARREVRTGRALRQGRRAPGRRRDDSRLASSTRTRGRRPQSQPGTCGAARADSSA